VRIASKCQTVVVRFYDTQVPAGRCRPKGHGNARHHQVANVVGIREEAA